MLHLWERGFPPPILASKWIELRNAVVHRGAIPTRAQALAYGQATLDVVAPVLEGLLKENAEHVGNVTIAHLFAQGRAATEAERVATLSAPMPLSLVRGDPQPILIEYISIIVKRRSLGL